MLLDIVQRLGVELRQNRGVPITVEYGPVAPARVVELRDSLVLEYDEDGDEIRPPRSPGGNPKRRFDLGVNLKLTLSVTATTSGARRAEHEERARAFLKFVLPALDDVLRGGQLDEEGLAIAGTAHTWRPGKAGFEPLVDAVGRPVPVGATYVIRLNVEDAITDVVWGAAADPTFATGAGTIKSTTQVFASGQSAGEGAGETACGAGI